MSFRFFFFGFLFFFLPNKEAAESSVLVSPDLFTEVVDSEPITGKASIAANEYTSNFFIALNLLLIILLIRRPYIAIIALKTKTGKIIRLSALSTTFLLKTRRQEPLQPVMAIRS